MIKTVLTISICMLLIFAAVPSASAATCSATGTYASLIALGATGCTLGPGDDLLFNNFGFVGGGIGVPVPTAASVTYTIENPGTSTLTGQLVYGFLFNPVFSVAGAVNTVQDAALVYDINIVNPGSGARINSIHLFENALATGSGVASVTELDTGCVSVGVCSFINDAVSTAGGVGLHNDVLGLNLISLHVTKDVNVTTGGTAGSTATISLVRDSVDQTPAPEPATYSYMLGAGLLLLGGLRRRKA